MARSLMSRRLALLVAGISVLALGGPAASYAQTAPTTSTTSTTRQPTGAYAVFRASPTTDLVAGTVITVTADARLGTIRSLSAQVCRPSSCATVPPTPDSDAVVTVSASGPAPSYGLSLRFRVGIGTFGGDNNGGSFVCDAANPCQLAVSASMNIGGGSHERFPLTYAQSAPTTTSTSTTTTTTTTTTPSPICAVRDRIPAWLWTLLVRLFGVTC